jgi:hypothetical protein
MEDANARRRRDLEEILELRRSFGTLGRRLVSRQGPIRPGLVPFQRPSAAADRDLDARPEEKLDQEQVEDEERVQGEEQERVQGEDQVQDEELVQGEDQVSTTVRRVTPIVDEAYHLKAPPAPAADEPFHIPDPPTPPARRRLPWVWLVGIAAVVFALGMAVDHATLRPAPRPAPPASSAAAAAPNAPPSSAAPTSPPGSVPRSCLVTAQRADALIDMLVKNERGMALTKALQEYTQASQTCRKEASSR